MCDLQLQNCSCFWNRLIVSTLVHLLLLSLTLKQLLPFNKPLCYLTVLGVFPKALLLPLLATNIVATMLCILVVATMLLRNTPQTPQYSRSLTDLMLCSD